MKTIADSLLVQIAKAKQLGEQILQISDLADSGILYTFATTDVLVINCRDYETAWYLDEAQADLWWAIAQVQSSIQQIHIEKTGTLIYEW